MAQLLAERGRIEIVASSRFDGRNKAHRKRHDRHVASRSSPPGAQTLVRALPHMLRYDDAIVVVKYGGHAMGDDKVARDFARDMVLLEQSGVNPVVVHGGGPQIGAMLNKLGIKSEFAGGLRITDKATVEIVEMVLAGSINKQIVGFINAEGGAPSASAAKDGNMVTATRSAAPWSIQIPTSRSMSISASSANRPRSTRPCSTRCSAAN